MDNPKQLRPKIQVKTATQIRAAIDAANFISTIKAKGHADIHVEQSDVDSMERLLSRDTFDSSTFSDANIADYCINETLYANADQIETWLTNPAETGLQPLHANFDPDITEMPNIGHGFATDKTNRTIKEYNAQDATIILRKDRTNGYGFTMVTAYPNITTEDAMPTGRDLRPIVRDTPTYQKSSPLGKALLEHRCDPESDFDIKHFQAIAGKPEALRFSIPTDDPEVEHVITITESETTMTKKRNGVKTASDFTNLSIKPYGQSDIKQDVDLGDPMVWQAFSSQYPKYADTIKNLQSIITANTPDKTKPLKSHAKVDKIRQALLDYQRANPQHIGATFQKGDKPGSDQLSIRIPIDSKTNTPIDDPTKTDKFHFVNIRSNGASICTRQGREYVDSEFATPSTGKKFAFLSEPGLWEKFSQQYPQHAAAVTSLQTHIKANIPYAAQPLGTQPDKKPNSIKPPESMREIYENYRQNPERGVFIKHKSDPESGKEWLNLYIPVDKNDMSRVVYAKTTDTQHILHIYPNRMTVSTLQNREFIPSNLTDIQTKYIPESTGNNKVYLNDDHHIWDEFTKLYPKHAAIATQLQSQMQKIPGLTEPAPTQEKTEPKAIQQPVQSDKVSRITRAENLSNNLDWSATTDTSEYAVV